MLKCCPGPESYNPELQALGGKRTVERQVERVYDAKDVPDSAQMQARLYELQHPEDCTARLFLYFEVGDGWKVGLGAYLDILLKAFTLAYNLDRTLVVQTRPNDMGTWYSFKGACAAESYLCAFQPFSKCTEADFQHPPMPMDKASRNYPVLLFDGAESSSTFQIECQLKAMKGVWLENQAQEWHGPGSRLWIQSQLLGHLWKPNAVVLALINETKRKLGWRHPSTTVHVRRTDKVNGPIKEANRHELTEYLQQIESLQVINRLAYKAMAS
jgi:hypothetical protein